MPITVLDTKLKRIHVCSMSHAARIVGVHRTSILRWAYEAKTHEHNHYTIYFDTKIHKQPKGKHLI